MTKRRLLAALAVITLFVGSLAAAPVVGATHGIDFDVALAVLSLDREEDDREGPDKPITGSALDQAEAAAIEYLGEGRVTGTEVSVIKMR